MSNSLWKIILGMLLKMTSYIFKVLDVFMGFFVSIGFKKIINVLKITKRRKD